MAEGRPENPEFNPDQLGRVTTAEAPEPAEMPSPPRTRGIGGGAPGGGRPGDGYDEDLADPKRPR